MSRQIVWFIFETCLSVYIEVTCSLENTVYIKTVHIKIMPRQAFQFYLSLCFIVVFYRCA